MAQIQRFHIDDIAVGRVGGDVDAVQARAMMLCILAEPDTCLLVDCSASRHHYGFSDVLAMMGEAGALPEARAKRIALVNAYFNRSDLTLLMAEWGRHEGLTVRAFLDFDEAVGWLEEGCPAPEVAPAAVSARRAPAR